MTAPHPADDGVRSATARAGLGAVVLAAATYAAAGGLVTLVGWAADVQRLTDWRNDGISMFPNTAICALLSGLALALLHRAGGSRRALAPWVVLPVIVVAGLTLVEHLTGIALGIDTLLFAGRPWGQSAAAAPMRMGPPASIAFLLIGAGLALPERRRGVSAACGVIAVAIAMLPLIGRLYGAEQLYMIPTLTGIAMQTASMILGLGIGVVASAPRSEPMRTVLESGAAGLLVRRAIPVIVGSSLALGWLRVLVQNQGLVDTAFGTASRTLVEIFLLMGLLWWAAAIVRAQDERRRASEGEVRRQAGQLAAFLETAAIGLHRVGPDGTILWVNDAELETLGYTRDEYVGRNITEFHADQAVIADILARLHRGEKLFEYPAQMKCKDGSRKSVLIDSSVFWDDGRFVHTQCFTRDITDRQRAEAELAESNRRKDEFIAILAHELRNPLTPVRNAARYLRQKGPTDPDLRRSVDMIERQVAQMSRLIDDLLDVSRISRGALGLRRERVGCVQIVDAAVDACRDELQAKQHRLDVTLPPEPVELDADPERLVQVLSNLIGNAAKYTPAGGSIALTVGVGAHGMLEVSVTDDGIGIPPAKLTEIFDLFARVDHSFESQGGLGIGLTLVRQLVELHGGTIEARSQGIGHGSEFLVKLPIVATTVAAASTTPAPGPVCAPLRIVVADDNCDAVESLTMLLQLAGHEVRTAFDGEAAVAAVETTAPQVALLDIGMPKANGYEVARRIRAQPWGRSVYLVALTGWGQEADKRRAHDAGFDAHLVKPVSPDLLDRLLASIGTSDTTRRRA